MIANFRQREIIASHSSNPIEENGAALAAPTRRQSCSRGSPGHTSPCSLDRRDGSRRRCLPRRRSAFFKSTTSFPWLAALPAPKGERAAGFALGIRALVKKVRTAVVSPLLGIFACGLPPRIWGSAPDSVHANDRFARDPRWLLTSIPDVELVAKSSRFGRTHSDRGARRMRAMRQKAV